MEIQNMPNMCILEVYPDTTVPSGPQVLEGGKRDASAVGATSWSLFTFYILPTSLTS